MQHQPWPGGFEDMSGTGINELGIQARAQLEAGRWVQAATLFQRMEKSTRLSPNENVYYGVALTNIDEVDAALNRFTDTALASSNRRNFVRRRAVVPQLQSKNYSNAEAVLQRLLEIAPNNVANLGSLATIFLRDERDSDALACLEKAYTLNPDSAALRGRLLQIYLRLSDHNKACAFALAEKHRWREDSRFALSCALTLMNAQRPHDALDAADVILASNEDDDAPIAVAARVYFESGKLQEAMKICRTALHAKNDNADIRYIMARAYRGMGRDPSIATHHLKAGLSLDQNHLQSARMLGRLLMESGDFDPAVKAFENALRLDRKCMGSRIEMGRALHFLGRYDDASNVYGPALKRTRRTERWIPIAVSTLIAAGRLDEAEGAFRTYQDRKCKKLPKNLASGLQALHERKDRAAIEYKHLDWAWNIARKLPNGPSRDDRASWQRSALWGHRADSLISDWAECRPLKTAELTDLVDIQDDTRMLLKSKTSDGKGVIIATAHLGPHLSAPLALRKLGTRYNWLAPIPNISPVAADGSLISTSELSEIEVTFEFFHALAKGSAVALAVDGALDPSAPTILFEGRKIPHSDFAARAAYKCRVASFFAVPVWRDNRIEFTLRPMPHPIGDETLHSFISRWTDAYCAHLRNGLSLPPENLGLHGGIWQPR